MFAGGKMAGVLLLAQEDGSKLSHSAVRHNAYPVSRATNEK